MTGLRIHIVVGVLICLWFVIATSSGWRMPEGSSSYRGGSYGGGFGRGMGGSWGGGK